MGEDARKLSGVPRAVWIKWRMCDRKERHETKPPEKEGMRSYECWFCAGWHYATGRRLGKIEREIARKTYVLRGGFMVEK